eukprot:gene16710-biopygen25646
MLERVRILNAPRGVGLAGLPPSLRRLHVQLMPAPDYSPNVEELTDLPMSAALSALSALTQLEEAVLYHFPDTSLPAFEFCPALRSLHLKNWCSLTDVSALPAYSNLHTLGLFGYRPGNMSELRSRVHYEKVKTQDDSATNKAGTSSSNKKSEYKLDDFDWDTTDFKNQVPWGAIALAIFLMVFGIFCFVVAWLHVTQEILGKEQAEFGFMFLGFITFIPGYYHCRIAYYAMKGYPGFSFESIPKL